MHCVFYSTHKLIRKYFIEISISEKIKWQCIRFPHKILCPLISKVTLFIILQHKTLQTIKSLNFISEKLYQILLFIHGLWCIWHKNLGSSNNSFTFHIWKSAKSYFCWENVCKINYKKTVQFKNIQNVIRICYSISKHQVYEINSNSNHYQIYLHNKNLYVKIRNYNSIINSFLFIKVFRTW